MRTVPNLFANNPQFSESSNDFLTSYMLTPISLTSDNPQIGESWQNADEVSCVRSMV
jgi:hypothetical protein